MSKDAVADWDTTAGNNADIGGTDISGATGKVKDGDNALRTMMAQIKAGVPYLSGTTLISPGTSVDGLTLSYTDATAAAGPLLTLYRNSASPAASDLLGQVVFSGEDSAGNTQTYGLIGAKITEATSASEDAQLFWQLVLAGTVTTAATLSSGSLDIAGTAAGPSSLVLHEDTDNGTNNVTISAADSMSEDYTLKLPAAAGTAGQVLRMNSGATALEFASGWEPIEINTALSNVSTWSHTNLSSYSALRITGFMRPTNDGGLLTLRTSTDNGANYDSGASDYVTITNTSETASVTVATAASGNFLVNNNVANDASAGGCSFDVILEGFNKSTNCIIRAESGAYNSGPGNFRSVSVRGERLNSTARNAFTMFFTTTGGNIATGRVSLWGLRG